MHWQYEVCLAELVLVITCQNMCYSYREFWQAFASIGFAEHASVYKKEFYSPCSCT